MTVSRIGIAVLAFAAVPCLAAQNGSTGPDDTGPDPVKERILWQRATENEPYVFQAYKPNYILPISYVKGIKDSPYQQTLNGDAKLQHAEVKFQFSFRANLWPRIAGENTDLSFGYTQRSFFQAYNADASRPFRETDYSPELWFDYYFQGEPAGLIESRILRLGYQHQSNGQQDPLSRSWDRLYLDYVFEIGRVAVSLRPWYRIPERSEKDDNPDIEQYMGYGDLVIAYPTHGQTFSLLLRNNLDWDQNRGAAELGYSFPLDGQLKGYVQAFTGYGESLIDYNHPVSRVGIGIMLNDWL